jgi:hypothetical protein
VLFGQGRPFWVATVGLLLAYIIPLPFTSNPEDLNRYAGMVLQLCGLFLVARGIAETRQLFGKPSLVQRIKAWVDALVASLRAPRRIDLTAAFTGTGTLTANIDAVTVKPGQSLDVRVAELERRLVELQDAARALERRLKNEAAERRAEITREVTALRAEIGVVQRQMEEYAAGGLSFEMAGLVWLLVGTLVGSLPGELAFIANWVLSVRAWIGCSIVAWIPTQPSRWK